MRTLAVLLAALFFGLVAPSVAAPPDHANGNANGAGQGNGGGQGIGGGNGNGGGGPAATPDGVPAPSPAAPAEPPGRAGPADQDDAQSAVERLEALPLAKIIKIAETRDKGEVINARLVRVSGVLLYQLTLLNDAGHSWRVYYHALRGNPVVLP